MFSHLWILKDTRDVTPFQTETSADKDLSVARQSAKQKNIIIVIKKSICKVSQNCPASASINQTLLFCCVVFYLVFFCFASFLIIVSDCISTSPLAFFSIVITIIKFNNKLVTINFERSKYKKDFHLSPPNILLLSHVNSSRKL